MPSFSFIGLVRGFRLLAAAAAFLAFVSAGWAAASGAKAPPRGAASHRLQPMDLVRIQVFQEPDLEREVRVSQDHKIVVPLVGVVDVRNQTVRDIEVLLTELYEKDYLVNPQITLTVVEYAQRTVNVLGAVNNPGSVVIPPERDITLLDAIARSGGFSRLANRSHISLTRTLPDGQTVNFTINADQLMTGDAASRWPIQDGDIISVPERVI